MDSSDNAINLVQLGGLIKDSQPSFVNVNCIYQAYNPTSHQQNHINEHKYVVLSLAPDHSKKKDLYNIQENRIVAEQLSQLCGLSKDKYRKGSLPQ